MSNFKQDPALAEFSLPKQLYLAAHPNACFDYIATSTLVLDTSALTKPRILLLQRSASDSDPNKWEPPGGACDDDDLSILHGAARELWEEAGLQATRFCGQVSEPYFFTLDDGKIVCQFNFLVQVDVNDYGHPPDTRLDPKEHQRFIWATEDEVKARRVDDVELDFTRAEVERTVLLAFQYVRKAFGTEEAMLSSR
ncbi:hypothetical protein HBH42_139050 [Parastagonospora nodorum]|nr:hypothetical protein HBH42_139050 [Parastagonospora nodorum]